MPKVSIKKENVFQEVDQNRDMDYLAPHPPPNAIKEYFTPNTIWVKKLNSILHSRTSYTITNALRRSKYNETFLQ